MTQHSPGPVKQHWREILSELLKNKANLLIEDKCGWTPLLLIATETRFAAYAEVTCLPDEAIAFLELHRSYYSNDSQIVYQIDYLLNIAYGECASDELLVINGGHAGSQQRTVMNEFKQSALVKPTIECCVPGCVEWFVTEGEYALHMLNHLVQFFY